MSKFSQGAFAHLREENTCLWNEAISEARLKIEKAEQKVAKLKASIRTFEELRDRGEPFFDEPVAKEQGGAESRVA